MTPSMGAPTSRLFIQLRDQASKLHHFLLSALSNAYEKQTNHLLNFALDSLHIIL